MTVKTVNGVRYVVDLVSESKWSIKSPYSMKPKKVTLHNADNEVSAEAEASYHNKNDNQVSYHLVADEKEARQLLPFDRNGWHSGDGLNGYGNRNTIAMEIARNYDRKRNTTDLNEPLKSQYEKAEENAIKVLAQVMIDEGIVANDANIKTHNNWNGKWCPRKVLNEKRLQSVKTRLIAEYNRLKSGGQSTSHGFVSSVESVVDYMNRNDIDSSYSNRAKLAEYYGIKNYSGSASQNIELLNILKNPPQVGWIKNDVGWWYKNADGTYPRGEWKYISKQWYLFDSRGYMLNGWQKTNSKWYYMNEHGHMQKGWLKLGDTWYYLDSNGAMVTGWMDVKNYWYYFNSNGSMATGWIKDEWERWFYLHDSGHMATGLLEVSGKHYYLERNGALITDESIKLEANKHGHLA